MCGITGFLGFTENHDTVLRNMIAAIHHRGPDAQNHWTDSANEVALGHARLSIVDLSDSGAQPMKSASGRYVCSYNGEIYNHLEIRQVLEAAGEAPRWRGSSDTETLLAAIDCWGLEASLEKCIGMFALAIWDHSHLTLTLVRDRFGEKPLYYQPTGHGVIFASELASIKQHPDCERKVSPLAARQLAEFDCVPAPLSIYHGVYKLLPGTLITFNNAGYLATCQWWSPYDTACRHKDSWSGTEAEALVELEERLSLSVKRQMLADVPLGAFLSGGIDSSLIVALMQQHSNKPVKTFTIGFDQPEFDEAPFAKRVAQHLGTDHTELYVTDKQVHDLIPQLPTIYSEPFADSSQIPTHLVSALARESVTVALSGDAGDEIFAGYSRHTFVNNHWATIRQCPRPLRKAIANLIRLPTESQLDRLFGLLPMTSEWTRVGEKLKRSAHALSASSLQELYGFLTRIENSDHVLDGADSATDHRGPQSALFASTLQCLDDNSHDLDSMRWLMIKDQSDYLPNDVLAKVDRASMACSLETRAPFLDHTVVEFSQTLPSSVLVDGKKGKKLLRSVLGTHVPDELFERPKMGFSIPVYQMIKNPLRDWAEELLSESAIHRGGAFDAQLMSILWQEHLSGKHNHIAKLWPVLMYQAWCE